MSDTVKENSRSWQSVCDEFYSTQMANYQASPCPLPSLRLPRVLRALPYRPSADENALDQEEMDVTEDVRFHFAEHGRGDVRLKARVYRIPVGKHGCFRVVSAFLSPEGERPADGADLAALREYMESKYEIFRKAEKLPTLHYYYIVASERPFAEDCMPLARPTVVLCRPLPNGLWDFRLPRGEIDMPTADFLLHVLPGLRGAYADAMAAEIEHWDKTRYITPSALRERLQLDASVYSVFMSRWLDTLFERGGYGRDSDGCIYGRETLLPPGKGAKRLRVYDMTRRRLAQLNGVSMAVIAGILAVTAASIFLGDGANGRLWAVAWGLLAVAGLFCQWRAYRLKMRGSR